MSTLKVNEIDTKTGTTITVAAGKTIAGTDIIDTAQIKGSAVGATELAATLDLSSKTVTLAAGEISAGELAATLDLSSKTVTVPASTVTTHVTAFDDAALRNDIATLALHSAIADNKAAYNLSNSFIDQYEDDTGIDVETTCDRNAAEYMTSIVSGTGGEYSGIWDSTTPQGLRYHASANYAFPGDFTIEWWQKTSSTQVDNKNGIYGTTNQAAWTSDAWHVGYYNSDIVYGIGAQTMSNTFTFSSSSHDGNWHHLAFVRDSNTLRAYRNGVASSYTTTNSNNHGNSTFKVVVGGQEPNGNESFNGLLDNVRVSNSCRYPSGTTFAVPTADFVSDANTMLLVDFENASFNGVTGSSATTVSLDSNIASVTRGTDVIEASVINATGNFTSATQASTASVSSMGIVVLYKNNAGTATLNTDIVAQVSANGGTNYANATLVAGGTFSTGINIAAVSGVSVTAGTTPKYKISFANQASASKETQVHGVALLY